MTPLFAILHRWASVPFVWGETDCCLCLADWFAALHGKDPAAHLRLTYHDAGSCQRACQWFTDPVAVIESCFDTVRGYPGQFRQVNEPRPGDVAVITLPSGGRVIPAGAIWTGSAWGCKGPDGATTLSPKLTRALAIWDIGYEG